jgi:hypothetical protein
MIALAQRLRRGPGGLGRSVLLLIGVIAAILVGLLAMHSLNTPAAHAEPAAAASIHEMAITSHGDAQPSTHDHCGDCGGHHNMLAMVCVLALLVITLLLLLPGPGITWMAALRRAGPFPLTGVMTPSKPPSLLVFCISRT